MAVEPFGRLGMGGRVVIVTGGGSGIGAATAKLLGARGATVVVADINDRGGEAVAADIRATGARAVFRHTDVANEEQVKGMVDFAVAEFGGLHAAFNNAGMTSKGASLIDLKLADWRQMIDVNLTSVFLCMKYQIAYM